MERERCPNCGSVDYEFRYFDDPNDRVIGCTDCISALSPDEEREYTFEDELIDNEVDDRILARFDFD